MRLPHNSNNLAYVRSLRKNMTDAERNYGMNICVPAPTNSHAKRALGPISLIFIVLLLSWQLKLTVRSITNRRGSSRMLPELLICRRLVFLFCGFPTGTFFSIWRVLQPELSVRF